jgi:hypothetical protein
MLTHSLGHFTGHGECRGCRGRNYS